MYGNQNKKRTVAFVFKFYSLGRSFKGLICMVKERMPLMEIGTTILCDAEVSTGET